MASDSAEKECSRKLRLETRGLAVSFAWQCETDFYRCTVCQGYHLTERHTPTTTQSQD